MISGSIQYRAYLENILVLYRLEKAYESKLRKAEQAGDTEYNEARRRHQMFDGKWHDFELRLDKLRIRLDRLRSNISEEPTDDEVIANLLLRDANDVDIALREIATDVEHCEQTLAWIERNSI